MPSTTISQANRPLEIQTPLGANVLGLRRILVQERLGRPFAIEADMSSEDPDIKFDDLIGHPVVIRLNLPSGEKRFWHAFVARFQMVGKTSRYFDYRASLVPWVWVMSRGADFRIFQKQNVPDIVQDVFRQRGAKDFETRLSWTYDPWEYCVQYRETDLNFVSRLLEQEGITYYYKHDEEKGTLVLADDKAAYDPVPGYEKIPYRPSTGSEQQQEAIRSWIIEHELQPTEYSVNDYNPLEPATALKQLAQVPRSHGAADRQIFDYPGEYETAAQGENVARIRLEELQAGWQTLRAETNCMGLYAGCLFNLTDHPRAEQNREHLVTAMQLQFDAGDFDSDNVAPRFSCSFTAIPSEIPYRPPRATPKPVVQGPQSAVVVGPKGEEIHTDEHGRVKVHFYWNRESKGDENSSCWIRVAQGWAGKKWGSLLIPRIGHEVLVEFLEGDPDRPVITGSVYNGANAPPYDLPANKTQSTLKSSSSKGGEGFNELRFEDKKGSEEIHVHAERNLTMKVKANQLGAIGGERHETVEKKVVTHFKDEHHLKVTKDEFALHEADTHATIKGSRLELVEGAESLTVKGDQMIEIKGAESVTVGGDRMTEIKGHDHLKVSNNLVLESTGKTSVTAAEIHGKGKTAIAFEGGMNVHIKGGMKVVIEAGIQLSLKAAGSFVDISPTGVSISGPMVGINSGGSAASGDGCSVLAPTAPASPEAPDTKDPPAAPRSAKPGKITSFSAKDEKLEYEPLVPAAYVLEKAAKDGTPFCEECAKEPDEENEEEIATISSITLLDGDADAASTTQIVNLPREDKWVDRDLGITAKERLGPKLKFKVTFSNPGAHPFKVRLVPGDDNVIYTDAEKGRNAAFKFQEQTKDYTTGGDGTKIIDGNDFFVTCAGLDTFKLVAEDTTNATEVESAVLTLKRIAYYTLVVMKGETAPDFSEFRAEFAKRGLELKEVGSSETAAMPNISTDQESTYESRCKTAFEASDAGKKKPYGVAVGVTNHLAVKNPSQQFPDVAAEVGPDKPVVDVPCMCAGLTSGTIDTHPLWNDIVPGEGWFVSAQFLPDGGGAPISIPEAKCTGVPDAARNPSKCSKVRVDVTGLAAARGKIRVTAHVVDRMRNGLSFGGVLICVCTRVWWRSRSASEINQTCIHEMGHKIGMVTDGTGKKPDRVPEQYTGKGHVGSHCHNGLPVQASYSGVSSGPKCVMFGSRTNDRPNEFCVNCAPSVRKTDLSAGWS